MKKKRKLRDPLDTGEKLKNLAEKLKKKYALKSLYKTTKGNKLFLNRDFYYRKKSLLCEDTHKYWLKESNKQSNNRFYRQALFTLNNQLI